MSDLNKIIQEQHDQMLRSWINALKGMGLRDIAADLPDYPLKPESIGGKISRSHGLES